MLMTELAREGARLPVIGVGVSRALVLADDTPEVEAELGAGVVEEEAFPFTPPFLPGAMGVVPLAASRT